MLETIFDALIVSAVHTAPSRTPYKNVKISHECIFLQDLGLILDLNHIKIARYLVLIYISMAYSDAFMTMYNALKISAVALEPSGLHTKT